MRVLNFVLQGIENSKRTLELVRKVGEVVSSTSHSSQGKTVVTSNFVDIAIYKENPEDLSGRNISEGGTDIVLPDSKNIFPKTNGSITLQVNRAVCSPKLWNCLPYHIRCSPSVSAFKPSLFFHCEAL